MHAHSALALTNVGDEDWVNDLMSRLNFEPAGAGAPPPSSPPGNGLDEDFELFAPITWVTLLLTPKGRRIVAAAGAVITVIAFLVVPKLLARAPATQANICQAYDELGAQLFEGNGVIGNPLFEKAGTLGDLATRHPGNVAVQTDGSALQRIADSSSTSGAELQRASRNIASMCGAPPLSLSPFFGR